MLLFILPKIYNIDRAEGEKIGQKCQFKVKLFS